MVTIASYLILGLATPVYLAIILRCLRLLSEIRRTEAMTGAQNGTGAGAHRTALGRYAAIGSILVLSSWTIAGTVAAPWGPACGALIACLPASVAVIPLAGILSAILFKERWN